MIQNMEKTNRDVIVQAAELPSISKRNRNHQIENIVANLKRRNPIIYVLIVSPLSEKPYT